MKQFRFTWVWMALALVLIVGVSVVTYAAWQVQRRFAPKPTEYSSSDLAKQAKAQLDAGNYQIAESYLKQALLKEDDHTYRSQLAVVEYRLKKYPEAIKEYQLLVSNGQDVAFAQNGIGNANRDWGEAHYAHAETAYAAAISADPHYVAAYSNLALLLYGEGKVTESEKVIQQGKAATGSSELSNLESKLAR